MQGFKGKFVKGSQPESVYWRRRAIVAGAVIVLVLLVVLGISALGGGDEEPEAKGDAAPNEWVAPSQSSTLNRPYVRETPTAAEPSGSPSPTGPVVVPCEPEDLMLQVVAAFDEVRSGSEVPVSVLVASGADATCTADLREVAVELTAGADIVYSTAHCETPQGEEVELSDGAGQTVEFSVDGLASEAECAGARRELPAGEYELRARLGEAVSAPTNLRLT
ncbi:hypothetical protein [Glycomyces algeriensis]|uniref:MucR family transcriptional regulator n=1 Tax=Glycomyces algeriensis TaxID=256037 RepID=A0A9W6LEV6_9ACTN|nr:hypothetical protein [Glycomyces algeriensis]MDA1367013.1 hypothetical protein [Glycomyces algeriensis]MDR7348601.1 hypothetical protein [Glycomyces algeriensis]GLI41307.1 hypothetical protein GALLR39Z86_11570 [Glycomyces algeriensis]